MSIRIQSTAPDSAKLTRPFRTPLTGRNRSRPMTPKAASVAAVHLVRRCRDCGAALRNPERTYCDECLPEAARRASAKAVVTQRQLRSVGEDRRQSESARAAHRKYARRQQREQREWEAKQTVLPNRRTFDTEILPLLRDVPDAVLARSSGLSRSAMKSMRAGRMRPHPRYWDALRHAAATYRESSPAVPTGAPDPQFYARRIAPYLGSLGADGIRAATSLSHSYCRRVLHGHHVPHQRHWPALAAAVNKLR